MSKFLVKKIKIDVEKTLKNFSVGDSDLIPYSESKTDINSIRATYKQLINKGRLSGRFRFLETKAPAGEYIERLS